MATVVVDELITKLTYQHDAQTVRQAEQAVKQLEATNKTAAESADKLAAEQRKLAEHTDALTKAQIDLSEQIAESNTKTAKLRDEQRELRASAKAAGGATEEQKRRLAELDAEIAASQRHTRELREENARLGVEKRKVATDARKLSREQKDVNASAREAAEGQRKLKEALRESEGAFGDFGKQLATYVSGNLASDTVRALIDGVVELGKEIIVTGANFESLRARLKTVEGSTEAAGDAFRLIQDFAKATPFEVENITEAFTALRVRGVQPTADKLTALGDMSSAFGQDFKDMTDAIGAAARGEFDPIEKFGVSMKKVGDQVRVSFKGQTEMVGLSADAITDAMVRFGQMNGIQGAMAEQSMTTAGMFSNLKDTFAALFDTIAQMGVLDEVKRFMEALSSAAGEEGLAKVIADVLVIALRTLRELFEGMPQGALIEFLQSLVTILGMVASVLTDAATQSGGTTSTLFELGAAILDVVGTLYNLLGQLKEIKEAFGGVPGPLDVIIGTLKIFATVWEWAGKKLEYFMTLLQPLLDKLRNIADRVPTVNDLFSTLGAKLRDVGEVVDNLTGGFFGLNNELAQTKSAADLAREALEKLQAQNDYTKKSNEELQELRRQGDEKADAEIQRRVKLAEKAEQAEDAEKARKKKQDATTERADRLLDNPGRLSRRQLEAMVADPNLPQKIRDKAQKEIDKRDNKDKKDGAKAAKKLHDSLLTHQVAKDIEKLAKDAGARESARALLGGASEEEANRRELAQREAVQKRLTDQFHETGRLPPGISQDLVQVSNLPNIEQVGGRLAPPVITVINQRFEVHGNTFEANVSVAGTSATPAEIANAAINQARPVLWEDMARAIDNNVTSMRR